MNASARVVDQLAGLVPPERVGRFEARAGVPELPLVAPATVAEATEVVKLARAERWTLLPLGLGSKLGWARPPERCDLVLSSQNLRGIEAYEPADGTLTARAGTPWAELVAATAARHHLSPELPGAPRATLGGVLAAGASGLDRLRHGPVRHQVLGISALEADGSVVKSGGRVVKNVTGYDLHRLWCGSHGTLCFLLEATLRLYPAPPEHALLRVRGVELDAAFLFLQWLARRRVQAVAVVLTAPALGATAELALVLAGRAEALASELDGVTEYVAAQLAAPELLRGADALRARAELRELELADGRWAPLVLATRPSQLAAALARLRKAAQELGLDGGFLCHPLLGSVGVRFDVAALDAGRVAALARALDGLDVRWRGLGRLQPPLALPPAASALMLRLKQSLDPQGVFPRGRFDERL